MFPEGVMYATIRPAARPREDTARIQVTSHPGANSGPKSFAYLRIEGSWYGVDEEYYEVSAQLYPQRWAVNRWLRYPDDYPGGYRLRTGRLVDSWERAWPRLEEIAKATLDQFAADEPQWKQESVRLCLLRDWKSAQAAVTRYEAQLRVAQAKEQQAYAALHHTADDAEAAAMP
jgi:hypothetical protein